MKKIAKYTVFGLLICAVVAWAAPEKIQSDLMIFGRKASSADKVIEIEQDAGANNPKITSNKSNLDFGFFSKLITFGRGLAEDVRLIVDRGGSNPEMKWNETLGRWEFSNNGSLFKAIGSGGGGGGGVLLNENPGFEDGTLNWSASGGTFVIETTLSNVAFGLNSGSWDASAGSQTLSGEAVTVPSGLFGKVCSLSWYYKGGDANLKAQVYDGTNVIAESSALSAQATFSAKQVVYFTCPSSGTIQPRFIASADAAIAYFDDVKIGQETNFGSLPQSSWSGYHDSDCLFTTASASFAELAADSACTFSERTNSNFGTVTSALSGSDKLPGIVFTPKVSGQYFVCAIASSYSSSADKLMGLQLYDVTNSTVVTTTNDHSSSAVAPTSRPLCGLLNVPAAGVSTTLRIQGKSTGADTLTVGGGNGVVIAWSILSKDTASVEAISVDQAGWHIDANIGGANPALSNTSVATYTEITNSGLDMVINSSNGSAAAEIPCSSTNPSTGLTCSAGDESLGAAFVPPTAGEYEACFTVNHDINVAVGGDSDTVFQVVETPNNAQTILQEGGDRQNFAFNVSGTVGAPGKVCGTFNFSDTSKRTLRLMYEADLSGTINTHSVLMDRLASAGQRDMKITVRRKIQYADAIKFTNMATVPISTGMEFCSADIAADGASVTRSTGSCVPSVTQNSTGNFTANFASLFFAAAPYCQLTEKGSNGRGAGFVSDPTTSGANIITFATTTGSVAADVPVTLSCWGQ